MWHRNDLKRYLFLSIVKILVDVTSVKIGFTFIVRVCICCAETDSFLSVLLQKIGFGTQETEILKQPITTCY